MQTNYVADDSLVVAPVDAGTIEDVIRESLADCRLTLLDAGRIGAGPPPFNYCSIAWFYEGCPMRVCAEELARKLEPRCPPRDAGVQSEESVVCETVVWPFLPADR